EEDLWTAEIRVASPETLISDATRGLESAPSLAVLYGGSHAYDAKTQTLTLQIMLKNLSNKPVRGPFKLVVTSMTDSGCAHISNANNGGSFAGAVWTLSGGGFPEVLPPAGTSSPHGLKFRINAARCRISDGITLKARVFAAPK